MGGDWGWDDSFKTRSQTYSGELEKETNSAIITNLWVSEARRFTTIHPDAEIFPPALIRGTSPLICLVLFFLLGLKFCWRSHLALITVQFSIRQQSDKTTGYSKLPQGGAVWIPRGDTTVREHWASKRLTQFEVHCSHFSSPLDRTNVFEELSWWSHVQQAHELT